MLDFTDKEITKIKRFIEKYRNVSHELIEYQKKADEIQDKVIALNDKMKKIKEDEDKMMAELHKKYGEFSIQDIYNVITYGK